MFREIHNRSGWSGGKTRMAAAAAVCAAAVAAGVAGGVALAQVGGPNPAPATESFACCVGVMGCSAPCQNDANGESTEIVPQNVIWMTCPLVELITPGMKPGGPCQPLPPTVCGVEATWSEANCQGRESVMLWPEPNCSQSPGC